MLKACSCMCYEARAVDLTSFSRVLALTMRSYVQAHETVSLCVTRYPDKYSTPFKIAVRRPNPAVANFTALITASQPLANILIPPATPLKATYNAIQLQQSVSQERLITDVAMDLNEGQPIWHPPFENMCERAKTYKTNGPEEGIGKEHLRITPWLDQLRYYGLPAFTALLLALHLYIPNLLKAKTRATEEGRPALVKVAVLQKPAVSCKGQSEGGDAAKAAQVHSFPAADLPRDQLQRPSEIAEYALGLT